MSYSFHNEPPLALAATRRATSPSPVSVVVPPPMLVPTRLFVIRTVTAYAIYTFIVLRRPEVVATLT